MVGCMVDALQVAEIGEDQAYVPAVPPGELCCRLTCLLLVSIDEDHRSPAFEQGARDHTAKAGRTTGDNNRSCACSRSCRLPLTAPLHIRFLTTARQRSRFSAAAWIIVSVPRLVEPTVAVRDSFVAAMQEFAQEGRSGDHSMIGGDLVAWGSRWITETGFAEYVQALLRDRDEDAPRRPGWVPCTTLWWADGQEFLGRVAIRHRLTPSLLRVGGHIGYDVRRSARRQGHATTMLAAALPVAAGLGINPALITCDAGNLASRKVIESNGGIFEDQHGAKLRYWVRTSPRGDPDGVASGAPRG